MKSYYNIAIPIPENKIFTYYIDEEKEKKDLTGYRVLIPFGKKTLTGVVIEKVLETNINIDKSRIKEIIEILDDEPFFTSDLLQFAKWVADYYIAPLGLVIKTFLPQGLNPKSISRIRIKNKLSEDELDKLSKTAPKRHKIIDFLSKNENFLSLSYIKKTLKIKNIHSHIEVLLEKGLIEYEENIRKKEKIKEISFIEFLNDNNKNIDQIIEEFNIKKGSKQYELLTKLFESQQKQILLSEIINNWKFTYATVKSLQKKGLVNIYKTQLGSNIISSDELTVHPEKDYVLNDEQKNCLEQIKNTINNRTHQVFLLFGITGSGKTLVYIKSIEEALKEGKTAIVLVPEISLTPQLIDRFNNFFENSIVVLHSKISISERFDAYNKILQGKAKIVIGARSAVFAPIRNLGIIIVDEEHEHTYKQTSNIPYYNAKDCAIVRGKIENAVVLLGSATPSLESMYNAEKDKYILLRMMNRADNAQLPDIRIIDLFNARRMGQVQGTFSKELINEIIERIQKKETTILFQNRRGFSPFMECFDCRYVPTCKHCNVSLTYHKTNNKLICHYCGYNIEKPQTCPQCNSQNFKEIGYGTQRLEEQLGEILKENNIEARIGRMDLDTTQKKLSHRNILVKLQKREFDVLVGTQMIAKGLDFPNVTLVGVINADLLLYSPDFRASERTFQLLTQAAGRAGRAYGKRGLVIIQTTHPENDVIKSVLIGSYYEFYKSELKNRELAQFPPFTRLVLIEFRDSSLKKVETASKAFYEILPKNSNYIIVYPPVIPAISKIMNTYRKIIIIKNLKEKDPSGVRMRNIIKKTMEVYNAKNLPDVKIRIEVDAYSSF